MPKAPLLPPAVIAIRYHTYAYDVSSPALRFTEKPIINPGTVAQS